jgi:hypothetical protein
MITLSTLRHVAVQAKPMPSEAADYGEPYYFDLNWMSVKLTQLLLAEVMSCRSTSCSDLTPGVVEAFRLAGLLDMFVHCRAAIRCTVIAATGLHTLAIRHAECALLLRRGTVYSI